MNDEQATNHVMSLVSTLACMNVVVVIVILGEICSSVGRLLKEFINIHWLSIFVYTHLLDEGENFK
jgi:hypothetical protein